MFALDLAFELGGFLLAGEDGGFFQRVLGGAGRAGEDPAGADVGIHQVDTVV